MTAPGRHHVAILCLIAGSGFAFRLILADHQSLWPDEGLYLFIAQQLTANPFVIPDFDGSLFYDNPPLLMYVLAAIFRLPGSHSVLIAHYTIILTGTATIVLTWLISNRLFGKLTGLVSAALLAINPLHVWISTRVLMDVPLTFFIFLAIYMLIQNRKTLFYTFSILGLATKYPAMPILFLPPAMKLAANRPRICLALYLAGTGCLFLLLMTRPYFNTHAAWLFHFLQFFTWPDFREMYREIYFFDYATLAFFLTGFGLAIRQRQYSPLFFWLIIFGTIRLFLPWDAFRISRYSMPLVPAIAIFAAHGGVRSLDCIRKMLPLRATSVTLVFSAMLAFMLTTQAVRAYSVTEVNNRTFLGFDAAGDYLNRQKHAGILLTASPRQMKYFAPAWEVHDLPVDSSPEGIRQLIHRKHITHIAIDRWSPHQPSWAFSYFVPGNGFLPVFRSKNILIFRVSSLIGRNIRIAPVKPFNPHHVL